MRIGEEEKGTPVKAGALFSTGDPWSLIQFRRIFSLFHRMLSSARVCQNQGIRGDEEEGGGAHTRKGREQRITDRLEQTR